ncbi:Dual specificity protein kinase shkA [Tetrabaena socialis]|uniref:Dual specificity protein kinase shkA n=1 Tax=Tetrabaena socialis TaxID=47790 RepID=A0A2J7ZSF3_9CHLO|nr:Dual specificity protein kinase shkA [Tetrabaena socialis]|eukprot:PNH03197.1 Dual specificity protein kinase shkA [Tetrabaena socialis]
MDCGPAPAAVPAAPGGSSGSIGGRPSPSRVSHSAEPPRPGASCITPPPATAATAVPGAVPAAAATTAVPAGATGSAAATPSTGSPTGHAGTLPYALSGQRLALRYLRYWYYRSVSLVSEERDSAKWLTDLGRFLRQGEDADGNAVGSDRTLDFLRSYNSSAPAAQPQAPVAQPDLDLWTELPPQPPAALAVREQQPPLPPASFAVASSAAELLALLQEAWAGGPRAILMPANITIRPGEWPQDGAALSYNVTLVGPLAGQPVWLHASGLQLARSAVPAPGGDVAAEPVRVQLLRLRLLGWSPALRVVGVGSAQVQAALNASAGLRQWRDTCSSSVPTTTPAIALPLSYELYGCALEVPQASMDALLVYTAAAACTASAGTPAAAAGCGLQPLLAQPAGVLLHWAVDAKGQVVNASSSSSSSNAVWFAAATLGGHLIVNTSAVLAGAAPRSASLPLNGTVDVAASGDDVPCGLASLLRELGPLLPAAAPQGQPSPAHTAAIVGGVVGGAGAVLCVAAAVALVLRSRRRRGAELSKQAGPSEGPSSSVGALSTIVVEQGAKSENATDLTGQATPAALGGRNEGRAASGHLLQAGHDFALTFSTVQPLVAGRAEDRSDSSVVAMQLCLTMQWCEAGTLRDALQKGMFGAPSDQPTGRAQVAAPGASTSSSRGLDGANASAAGVAATAAAPLEPPSPTVASGTGAEAAAAGMAPAPVDAAAAAAAADDDDDDDASAALSAAAAALGGARTRVTSWDDLTPVHNLALALLAARDVLSGLEYLHRCAVVHGDLTGSNILLKRVWPVLPAAPAVAGPSGDAAPAAAHSGGGRRAPPGSPTSAAATANAVPLLCVTAPHSALDTARVAEPGPPAAAVAEVARRLLRHSFKIADFGLSVQMKGPDQTHASNMAQGTPFFVAPEVIGAGHLSTAADIYSFGVVMWLLLHGVALADVRHLLCVHACAPVAPVLLPRISPALPPAAADLLRACMRLQPAERPSASKLLVQVEELLREVAGPELSWMLLEAERIEVTSAYQAQ